MNIITPKQAGISPQNIIDFIEKIEDADLSTHNIILAKGENIFFEHYWKPFNKDFLHRQYSVSKSIVSLAVGFCEQDGLLSLDDKISKYFKKESENQNDENLKNQTIRDMLMMATAKKDRYWFSDRPKDRVLYYFENDNSDSRPPGTIFDYDSTGSFVLCALTERLTGQPFMDYLRIKLFDKIGVSKEAYCLKATGGHSWGDSAVLCTARDLLTIARFVMNKGKWNGEQILNEKYLTEATSKMIDNNLNAESTYESYGYGYYIWKLKDGFFFNGMGCQFALCLPKKDLILIYNGDNQGKVAAKKIILDAFYENIVKNPPKEERNDLGDYVEKLKLATIKGKNYSKTVNEINGVTYRVEKTNPMGLKSFRFDFLEDKGTFSYTNEQGDKKIEFGMCENVFGFFPEEGYSNEVGTEKTKKFYYKCAASAAWLEEKKLQLKIQIIDKYFGNCTLTFGFKGDKVGIWMQKNAEDFLDKYQGIAEGIREK